MDIRKFIKGYKDILRLKIFIREIVFEKGYGLVYGVPGGGKTFKSLMAVRDMYSSKEIKKVVVAEPQRYLRDYVAQRWLAGSVVIKARDELCPTIARISKNSRKEYLVAAFEECVKCPHFRKDTCPFYNQFRQLLTIDRGIVVTSHHLAPIVVWLFKPNLLVFDEAEDYLQVLNKPLDPKVLDELRQLDEKVYRRIKANLYEHLGKYYLKPSWFSIVGSKCLLVSATFPWRLQQVIAESYPRFDEPILMMPTYTIDSPNKDMLLVYDGRQTYKKNVVLEKQGWWREVIPRLIDMVNTAVQKFGVVGIVSKNKTMTGKLHEIFTNLGYETTSDQIDERPEPNAEVWIVTVRGKWYRGVSLRPRKLKDRKDFPITIAFYQAQDPKKRATKIPPWMWDDVDVRIPWELCNDLIRAENVQTLFRFNREREKKHLVVLFDRRSLYSLEKLLPSYVRHLKHKEIVSTYDNLVKRFIELVNQF